MVAVDEQEVDPASAKNTLYLIDRRWSRRISVNKFRLQLGTGIMAEPGNASDVEIDANGERNRRERLGEQEVSASIARADLADRARRLLLCQLKKGQDLFPILLRSELPHGEPEVLIERPAAEEIVPSGLSQQSAGGEGRRRERVLRQAARHAQIAFVPDLTPGKA